MTDATTLIELDRPPANAEFLLRRVQGIAGALFSVFLLLHLSNTLLGMFGPDTYNAYQRVIRSFYQQPLVELGLVFVPLIAHAVAGIGLYGLRRKRRGKPRLTQRLHSWAGLFLLLVIVGHVLATRGIAYQYGVFAEFEGLSFTLWWLPQVFYPYYFLLFMAGFYHGGRGLALLLKRRGVLRAMPGKRSLGVVVLLAAVGVSLALMGFGGRLFDIADPRDNDYARQNAQLFGIDLNRPR